MRRGWPLTARGTGAMVLAVVCIVVANEAGIPELVYFGMLLIVVTGLSLASLHLARSTAAVHRAPSPDVAAVGDHALVRVRVGVRTVLPTAAGTWHDTIPKGLAGTADGDFPALGSGLRGADQVVDLEYSVTGMRRGVHEVGPLAVRSVDPFGLARRSIVWSPRTPVTVAPAIVELAAVADVAGEAGGTQLSVAHRLGQGADNLTARPHAPGDSMRRIHWRATAHRDQLMVREEEQESTPEATVVIDRGDLRWSREARRAPGLDEGFEIAVSACVSAVARLVRDGYAVEVIDSDGTVLAERIDGGESAEVESLASRFATLTTRGDDHLARLPRLFAGLLTGPVIVITGEFDSADADALAPLVHHSTLPILLAVAPRDGALDRAADAGWRTAALDSRADLAAAWASVAERGVAHGAG